MLTGLGGYSLRHTLGARPLKDDRCLFRVWAPEAKNIELILVSPENRRVQMEKSYAGYWRAIVDGVRPEARYYYLLDGEKQRPDPASRYQPEGVHGPSEVIDPHFPWTDQTWHGIPLRRYVLYELHIGVFTPQGTFDAAIPHLDALRELGVNAVELMPVTQFPGARNWGYDGVYPFAVQNSYGGPAGLKRFVDAAHKRGIAVVLDVVYNHLGPEGNYLNDFGPYFTDMYKTPWGTALNFDGSHSDGVRHYFLSSATHWIRDYHIDGLRLDATHFIFDRSSVHFLQALAEAVRETAEDVNRRVHLFAESDMNDVRWIQPREIGGYGLDVQWNDDFQHALFTMLPGADAKAYLGDYGRFDQFVKAMSDGFVYSGEWSPFRKRRHGTSSRFVPGERLLVFMQNHDQVGNRPLGDRLCKQLTLEGLKVAAASYILSPYLPMLFMGEEYGDDVPFLYFTDHSDKDLIEAVRKGRAAEFEHFAAGAELPDPQAEETFTRCKLRHELRSEGHHKVLWEFYKELLRLRRELPPLAHLDKDSLVVFGLEDDRVLVMQRSHDDELVLVTISLNTEPVDARVPAAKGRWKKILDSADARWNGPGSEAPEDLLVKRGETRFIIPPQSAQVYLMVEDPGGLPSRTSDMEAEWE